MILQVCCLRDSAIDAYGTPYFVTHVGAAIRGFTDAINNPNEGNVSKHPEDFTLYHLGTYDDSAAIFELLDSPRQLARGQDLKSK